MRQRTALLSVKGGSGVLEATHKCQPSSYLTIAGTHMGRHAVSGSIRRLHSPPRVILRSGLLDTACSELLHLTVRDGTTCLDVPDVASVAGDLAALERGGNVVGVADGSSSGVDDPGALSVASADRRR